MTGEEKWDPDEALAFLAEKADDEGSKIYCGKCDKVYEKGFIHCSSCGVCKHFEGFPKWGRTPAFEKRLYRGYLCKECLYKKRKAKA